MNKTKDFSHFILFDIPKPQTNKSIISLSLTSEFLMVEVPKPDSVLGPLLVHILSHTYDPAS